MAESNEIIDIVNGNFENPFETRFFKNYLMIKPSKDNISFKYVFLLSEYITLEDIRD